MEAKVSMLLQSRVKPASRFWAYLLCMLPHGSLYLFLFFSSSFFLYFFFRLSVFLCSLFFWGIFSLRTLFYIFDFPATPVGCDPNNPDLAY